MRAVDGKPPGRLPRQIGFIIGNEACERFSFYGMRNVLTQFLVSSSLLGAFTGTHAKEIAAKEVFHAFVMGVYFCPLLGGWLSDRYLGKYRTIFWLSLVYCAGNACLALFPHKPAPAVRHSAPRRFAKSPHSAPIELGRRSHHVATISRALQRIGVGSCVRHCSS